MTNLLSAVLGVSFAAGLNTYATILALGILQRLGVVSLPQGLSVVGTTPVLGAAGALFLIEFVADKIPFVDSMWDGIHTVVRPAAGALLAYGVVGSVDPQWQIIAALLGGGIALTSHTAKASTRAAANLSPEPFSNSILSIGEDVLSFSLVWLATSHPVIAIVIVLALIIAAIFVIRTLTGYARRVFRRVA
jgi:hypothetical protein